MTSFLDIIAGIFIGGILLIIAYSALASGNQAFFNFNSDAMSQERLADISDIMNYDLRKMCYGVPEVDRFKIVNVAQANRFKFIAQLNLNSKAAIGGVGFYDANTDTIEYNITLDEVVNYGDTSLSVYRVERTLTMPPNAPQTMTVGKIANSNVFRYMDQLGNIVTNPLATKMVEVTLSTFDPRVVLSPAMVSSGTTAADSTYRREELRRLLRTSFWRQTRLVSRNLRR